MSAFRSAVFSLLPLALILALLAIPPAVAPTYAVMAPPEDPILQGRNCGGTSLIYRPEAVAGAADPILTAAVGPGGATWESDADFASGAVAGVQIANGGLRLAGSAGGWAIDGAFDSAAEAERQFSPAQAVTAQGTRMIAWQENTAQDSGNILFARSDMAQLQSGRRGLRIDDTGLATTQQVSPTLALDGGTLHAAWADRRGGSLTRIYYASSANGGSSWSANALVHNPGTGINDREPALVAAGGSLVLVWVRAPTSTSQSVHIVASRRSGGVWGAPVQVSTPLRTIIRSRDNLALVALPDGGALAAWKDNRPVSGQLTSNRIWVARYDPNTKTWGANTLASDTASAARPGLAVAADGTIYLVWTASGAIRLSRSTDNGQSWTPSVRVDDGTSSANTNPRVAVDSDGNVHCVWCQLGGLAGILVARSTDDGQTWGDRETIASTGGTASPPAINADPAGNVYIAWGNGEDFAETLYTARWPSTIAYVAGGTYTSPVLDAGGSARWSRLGWAGSAPAGTSITILARSGNTPSPDASWSGFVTISGNPGGLGALPAGRYLQWRAALSTSDAGRTPALDRVSVFWDDGVYLPMLAR